MRMLWLIFAQTVTVALAILFVVSTLKPEWLPSRPPAVTLQQAPAVAPDD
jgi:serine protease DegQ